VESANATAQKLLADNLQVLNGMANALLERETIVLDDIKNIIEDVKSDSKAEKESQPAEKPQVEDGPAETGSAETGSDQ